MPETTVHPPEVEAAAITATAPSVERPRRYAVVMFNDDYTPMDFVVGVLAEVFDHDQPTANTLTVEIHRHGRAICGEYSREMAETKVARVALIAEEAGHPLLCVTQPMA